MPESPKFSASTPEEQYEFYLKIAQRRLPELKIEHVKVLGLFFYDEERLQEFIESFERNELENFKYNDGNFQPYNDYAVVLQAEGIAGKYILVEVQYFDYAKEEEMVFCKKIA